MADTDVVDEFGILADDPEPVYVPIVPKVISNLAFSMKRVVLQVLLDKAAMVIPSKDILSVLSNFQITVTNVPGPESFVLSGNARMRVIASDLELSVAATTKDVTVSQSGTAVFPGRKFLDIVKEATAETIQVTVVNGLAKIVAGLTEWELLLQDGKDYPALPDLSKVILSPIDRQKFLSALLACRYAAATDTVRPSLMMISVAAGRMTACDGVRFQQINLGPFPMDLQIPIGAVDDLVKLLASRAIPEISVGVTANHLIFQIDADVFIAQKMMAVFPDMETLMLTPALKNNVELTVNRKDLIEAVRCARITADPETSAVVLQLSVDTVEVVAKDKYGNNSRSVVLAGYKGDTRQVVVNHKYLMDLLQMTHAKTCSFWLGSDTKTKKSSLMLKDQEADMTGIVAQMRKDWLK
jgi:DNA polymerase III subunit beta